MQNAAAILKRSLLGGLVVVMAGFMTANAYADSSSQTCTPPPSNQPGVDRPVGADADTYTYDCSTGLWENAYYTFDPATGETTPVTPPVYTYDPSSGEYDTSIWTFNAPTNSYVPVAESVSQPPAGADVVGGPVAAPVTSNTDPSSGSTTGTGGDSSNTSSDPSSSGGTSDSITNTGPDSNNTINGNDGSSGSQTIDGTGPDSNNQIGGSSITTGTLDSDNNAAITNLLTGGASTGDATVIGNTTAGDATSGNAQDIANIVNLLQSSSNALGGNTLTFVANVNGNVNGDLLINPASLGSVQPASTTDPSSTPTGTTNLTVNNQTNAALNNNIAVNAGSGNATVSNNTTGGNATSGSAEAIANVVNLIDSAISSGDSFVGVININGNLDGNIEVPQSLVNQLIASNVPTVTISDTGPSSNNSITAPTASKTITATNANNLGITNTVDGSAASGTADVTNNTSAGNATSGNASNSITAFNLTGSNVIGSNDLLVFVNVLGNWVGMIVDAPPGATAAELGGGITSNTPSSGNSNATLNNNANEQINNNIDATAKSGNATVSSNTSGGNATSGNADTAVNLLNVENSNLALTNWFGILFINVFGSWEGNFGIESPVPAAAAVSGNTTDGSSPTSGAAGLSGAMFVFHFVPSSTSGSGPATGQASTPYTSAAASASGGSGPLSSGAGITSSAVLTSKLFKTITSRTPTPQLQSGHTSWTLPIAGITFFLLYAIGDVIYTRRRKSLT